MSLKRNLLANYIGQAYVGLIGIVMLPIYLRNLGTEAYVLIGFYCVLQTWFLLLDLGLTPTLSRELSRYRAGKIDGRAAAAMVRAMEWILGGIGIASAIALVVSARWLADRWLTLGHLDRSETIFCIGMMGAMIAPRWLVGLYRAGLSGLEIMVPLNFAQVALSSVRAVGVWLVFIYLTRRPDAFFIYQGAAGVLELIVMRVLFRRNFQPGAVNILPDFAAIRANFGLAGTMGALAVIWIVMSQSDRLILSGILDLRSYGVFITAVTLAGGITLLATPLSQALQPRLTILAARGDGTELLSLFRLSSPAAASVVFAIAGVLACFASPILRAWTGSGALAQEASMVLGLYSVGNAIAAMMAIAFLIQFALGTLRWHLFGNLVFGALWIPGAYFIARRYGAVGAGWLWFGGNPLYLVGWLHYVFSRIVPSITWRWIVADIGPVVVAQGCILGLAAQIDMSSLSRLGLFASTGALTAILAIVGLALGSHTRRGLWGAIRSYSFA